MRLAMGPAGVVTGSMAWCRKPRRRRCRPRLPRRRSVTLHRGCPARRLSRPRQPGAARRRGPSARPGRPARISTFRRSTPAVTPFRAALCPAWRRCTSCRAFPCPTIPGMSRGGGDDRGKVGDLPVQDVPARSRVAGTEPGAVKATTCALSQEHADLRMPGTRDLGAAGQPGGRSPGSGCSLRAWVASHDLQVRQLTCTWVWWAVITERPGWSLRGSRNRWGWNRRGPGGGEDVSKPTVDRLG